MIAFILRLPSNRGKKGIVMCSLTFHLLVGKRQANFSRKTNFSWPGALKIIVTRSFWKRTLSNLMDGILQLRDFTHVWEAELLETLFHAGLGRWNFFHTRILRPIPTSLSTHAYLQKVCGKELWPERSRSKNAITHVFSEMQEVNSLWSWQSRAPSPAASTQNPDVMRSGNFIASCFCHSFS